MTQSVVNQTITHSELLDKQLQPMRHTVPGLLPGSGLVVIGGVPKAGKSLLITDLGLSIAQGGKFLNCFDVEKKDVLCISLEDSERSIQQRTRIMQPDCPGSTGLHFSFQWNDNGQGQLNALGNWLEDHKAIKVVIIDTIARFSNKFAGAQYAKQYERFASLKKFADERQILIVIIHHLRKAKSADPFEMFYGSNGISGAADAIWVLDRKRDSQCAEIIVTGRDIPDQIIPGQ